MADYVDLLFTNAPGPDSEFVEAEDPNGVSVSVGEWIPPEEGSEFWRFRITWTAIGDIGE